MQRHPYQCGWWNYGKFAADNSWYPGAQWTGKGYDVDGHSDLVGAPGWKTGFVAVYDWVCHAADTFGVCENGQVEACGKDASGAAKTYLEFPQGNINEAFTGDKEMRCFCDNEPSWYTGEGLTTAPPGARLFLLKWLEADPENNMWISQIQGPELTTGSAYYYQDGVKLSPSNP
mmetsp:Transcript_49288/g.139786  ORF Transcript_49288/g.139786 Transcript_49288/m.139786 type:complete len:174 (+) Transcript_49288:781-1302(+)